ncbi:hypothetical protein T4A_7689 [Trichinella pseudospiralis]|uniref:Uncharacterized protein n=1 Tax=Trichinella pseudospiralis TaxID=6337 RepID=A0A0V1EDN0_TRIPS|nr:hypothetical protein T4A_7689 [Trichinella pseudospiralis]
MNDCFSSSQLAVVATEQRHFRNKLIIVDSSDGLFHCGGWMEGANVSQRKDSEVIVEQFAYKSYPKAGYLTAVDTEALT